MINTNDLRNIAVVSHPNAGKTSLVEAMLNKAGLLERMGKVEDGNTVSDYDAEEIKRGISVNTSVIPIFFKSSFEISMPDFLYFFIVKDTNLDVNKSLRFLPFKNIPNIPSSFFSYFSSTSTTSNSLTFIAQSPCLKMIFY